MKGRAEIVGGGLAGLAAAVALARRGWSVRVHERAAELREIGAGLYLKENGVRALDNIGVSGAALARATRLDHMDVVDMTSGRTLSRDVQGVRVYAVLRTDLHRTIAAAATTAGVEVATESVGVAATPEGRRRSAEPARRSLRTSSLVRTAFPPASASRSAWARRSRRSPRAPPGCSSRAFQESAAAAASSTGAGGTGCW